MIGGVSPSGKSTWNAFQYWTPHHHSVFRCNNLICTDVSYQVELTLKTILLNQVKRTRADKIKIISPK